MRTSRQRYSNILRDYQMAMDYLSGKITAKEVKDRYGSMDNPRFKQALKELKATQDGLVKAGKIAWANSTKVWWNSRIAMLKRIESNIAMTLSIQLSSDMVTKCFNHALERIENPQFRIVRDRPKPH